MTVQTIIILVLIGLLAGTLGGMVGLGGGIIIIPALVMFLSMDQRMAQGTTVAVMLPPIGLLAAYNYYKAGYVDIKYALIIAAAFIIGGYLGSKFALSIPQTAMRKGFAVLLLLIAAKMFFQK
ncbi:MAG: sulfite exporter TauE/SafE family protein [Bacteroidetes bacterium]|nr:sulfite exporter TauE/SafE family protein [Bacteroidota bacterium]